MTLKPRLQYNIIYKDNMFALLAIDPRKPNEKMMFVVPDEVFKLMQKCYKKEKKAENKTCPNAPTNGR